MQSLALVGTGATRSRLTDAHSKGAVIALPSLGRHAEMWALTFAIVQFLGVRTWLFAFSCEVFWVFNVGNQFRLRKKHCEDLINCFCSQIQPVECYFSTEIMKSWFISWSTKSHVISFWKMTDQVSNVPVRNVRVWERAVACPRLSSCLEMP